MDKNFRLHQNIINVEGFIHRINAEMPDCLKDFNKEKIKLHDTSKLEPKINKAEWLSDVKKLRWYGPYAGEENIFVFQTASETGTFQGYCLMIALDELKLVTMV